MALRTFLGLDLDDSILDGFEEVGSKLDDPQAKIRWVARENLHVTMQFLGSVADERTSEVCKAVADGAAQVQPFDFELRHLLCVPPRGQLRMVWVGVHDPSGRLASLHEIVAGQLSGLGFREEDRAFRPHITLARVKSIRNPEAFRETAAVYRERNFGVQHVAELVTYSSQLTPDGPIYTPIARAALGR